MTIKNNIDENIFIKTRNSMDSFEVINAGNYQIGYFLQTDSQKDICEDGLLIKYNKHGLLLAVCDGVGGSDRSYRATKAVLDHLSAVPIDITESDLDDEIAQINNRLMALEGSPQTTLSMIILRDDSYINYQIGDSGVIHCSNQENLKLKSIMHSPVGDLILKNELTEEQALKHPELNIVSNILGCPDCFIDVSNKTTFLKNDTLLLTTDGILDNYLTQEIISLISKSSLNECCKNLTESCKDYYNIIKDENFYKIDDISFICLKQA